MAIFPTGLLKNYIEQDEGMSSGTYNISHREESYIQEFIQGSSRRA
jgi:hypothetical protein